MEPVQFALKDKAAGDFLNFYSGSGSAIWGWGLLFFLLLIVIYIFSRLYKANKKNSKNKGNNIK